MRFLLRLIGFVVFSLPLLLAALLFFSLQQQPLVDKIVYLNHTDIARAKKIIQKNDPRRLLEGQKKSVTITSSDLSIALNHLFSKVINGGFKTKFSERTIDVYGTAILPTNPIGKYLNLKLTLIEEQQQPEFIKLSIGKVEIPGILLQQIFSLYADTDQGSQLAAVADMLQSIQIDNNKLKLSYIWNSNTVKQVKNVVVTQQDNNTLLVYQNQLAKISNNLSKKHKYSFTVILEPMFRYAAERSESNDPIVENRALIMVLSAYIEGRSLQGLPGSKGVPPKRVKLVLHNRHDFVQHFTISAGLAVTGGSTLADAIGLYKEYEDKKGRSGFSFTDLAADRAGVRLGKLATASDTSARRIQLHMSNQLTESIFMPKTSDLPENISDAVFQSKYQNGNGPGYQRIVELIEKRIDALAIN